MPNDATPFREWRKRHGYTQAQAAKAIGHASRRHIIRYENGQAPIPQDVCLAMLGHDARPIAACAAQVIGRMAARCEDATLVAEAAKLLVTMIDYLADSEIVADGGLTPAASAVAASEGWGIFWSDILRRVEIQRDDERDVFTDDLKAFLWVRKRSKAGSRLHRLALEVVSR